MIEVVGARMKDTALSDALRACPNLTHLLLLGCDDLKSLSIVLPHLEHHKLDFTGIGNCLLLLNSPKLESFEVQGLVRGWDFVGAWAQRSQAFTGKFLHSDSVQYLLIAPELKKLLICSGRTLNLSGVCVCICVMGFLRRFHGAYNSRTINRAIPCIQRRLLSGSISKINVGGSVLPVLIVGAGPVGLVLSILLTKLGVKCAVLEKNKAFSKHPQAHFVNNRSMEVVFILSSCVSENKWLG
ncbi:FAD NAD(P)-binding oxidoreductase family [Olea europaea subsp. europaea]|uniref:FAD NAD(P)-binding oxidoreductase family n=1 Tax=Olea europaea subsp. europaea TaxID=158383 RepID=A0A8S0Q525_OLEEU|nr:FAD NAD(P)-binding oxidoreductase family [Olea europaea subsp. europaea]